MIHEISSPRNPGYRLWLSLLEAKGIKQEELALASGAKIVEELLLHHPERLREILLPPKAAPLAAACPQTRLSSALFKALDVSGTKAPLAVVTAPRLPDWKDGAAPERLELILALSDPGNLGACLRSAEAFGARRVILTEECCSPYLPKAVRASSGSVWRLNLATTASLNKLSFTGTAIGLDLKGENVLSFRWPRDAYLILGEEGRGLPPSLSLTPVRIPMQGGLDSLNATVAASIAMFSYFSTWSPR